MRRPTPPPTLCRTTVQCLTFTPVGAAAAAGAAGGGGGADADAAAVREGRVLRCASPCHHTAIMLHPPAESCACDPCGQLSWPHAPDLTCRQVQQPPCVQRLPGHRLSVAGEHAWLMNCCQPTQLQQAAVCVCKQAGTRYAPATPSMCVPCMLVCALCACLECAGLVPKPARGDGDGSHGHYL